MTACAICGLAPKPGLEGVVMREFPVRLEPPLSGVLCLNCLVCAAYAWLEAADYDRLVDLDYDLHERLEAAS